MHGARLGLDLRDIRRLVCDLEGLGRTCQRDDREMQAVYGHNRGLCDVLVSQELRGSAYVDFRDGHRFAGYCALALRRVCVV